MLWLFIDTSVSGECRFGLFGQGNESVKTVPSRASSLLPLLSKHIGLAKLKKLQGICVVAGPGSFSSVRGGVLVANLLARLIRLPLIGVSASEANDLNKLWQRIASGDLTPVAFVAPIYSSEPNITLARP